MLLNNVIVTGGGSSLKNICARIRHDLVQNSLSSMKIQVSQSSHPSSGVFRGMMQIYNSKQHSNLFMTRGEYHEYGPHYLKENNYSNLFVHRHI